MYRYYKHNKDIKLKNYILIKKKPRNARILSRKNIILQIILNNIKNNLHVALKNNTKITVSYQPNVIHLLSDLFHDITMRKGTFLFHIS